MNDANIAAIGKPESKVLYLCDRRACPVCHEECSHTDDITHARNFELTGDGYFERPSPMVILRYPGMLSEKAKQKIKDDIDEQLKNHSGILITDGCPEIIKIGPEEDASRLFGGNPVPPPAIATLSKEDNIND